MDKKAYHHGNLHEALIEESTRMIHEEGLASFSLRKLAKRLNVTATAIYNHYSNLSELLNSIHEYVDAKYCQTLLEISMREYQDPIEKLLDLGINYVTFFADNPHYFSFLFDGPDCTVTITDTEIYSSFDAITVFKSISIECFERIGIPKEHYRDNLVVMWSTVHGFAAMANMKGFSCTEDLGKLIKKLLRERLIIG